MEDLPSSCLGIPVVQIIFVMLLLQCNVLFFLANDDINHLIHGTINFDAIRLGGGSMFLGKGRLDFMLVAFAIHFIGYILAKVVLAVGLSDCNFVALQESLLDITLEVRLLMYFKCFHINSNLPEHDIFKSQ